MREVLLLGMGTSRHAAVLGELAIEDWAGIHARAVDAAEFRYRRPTFGRDALAVVITQSGETADTLAGMRLAKDREALTVAVTNVFASSAARDADGAIYLHSGPEIGVASTKTYLAHVVSLYLLAMRLATAHGRVSLERKQELVASLRELPDQVRGILEREKEIASLAHKYSRYRSFLYTGRGFGFPVALEGALKLKEISYISTDAYAAGEMKHGPIALLDEATPVICVATRSPVLEKLVSNIQEARARGAHVIAVTSAGEDVVGPHADATIEVPATDWMLQPVLAVIPLQLLAYDIARRRNLAKTVTVE